VAESGEAAVGVDDPEQERQVNWAELFFDLVFVFAVTEVSALLTRDHTWAGLLRALVVFVPLYWLWVGTSFQANQRDVSGPRARLALFAVALAAVFMALAVPQAFGERGLLYAGAYWAGRLALGVPLGHRVWRERAVPANPHVVAVLVTGPLLVAGAWVHGPGREAIWGLAALTDLSSLTVLRSRLIGMRFDAAHLAERFGLFVLIALGESVVAIGGSAQADGRLPVQVGAAVAAAFAVSCGLGWVYFHFASDAMRHALATASVPLDVARLVLSYAHLSFIGAIIMVAVGMRGAVHDPGRPLGWPLTGLLLGGAALYLATFGFTRWIMFRLTSVTRLAAAAVVLLVLPVAPYLNGLADLTGLAIVIAVLNAVELASVDRIGWRARLRRSLDEAGDGPGVHPR
jgi:low temperature requirement protein LtrA